MSALSRSAWPARSRTIAELDLGGRALSPLRRTNIRFLSHHRAHGDWRGTVGLDCDRRLATLGELLPRLVAPCARRDRLAASSPPKRTHADAGAGGSGGRLSHRARDRDRSPHWS